MASSAQAASRPPVGRSREHRSASRMYPCASPSRRSTRSTSPWRAAARGSPAASAPEEPSCRGPAVQEALEPSSNTVPHSLQRFASSVTRAPQIGHTNPRNTTPRRPKPRSRFALNSSARRESNSSGRRASNSRGRPGLNLSSRSGLKFRRPAIALHSPPQDIRAYNHKRCVGIPRESEEDAALLLDDVQHDLRVRVLDVLHRAEALDERIEFAGRPQPHHDDRVPLARDVVHVGDALVFRDPPLDLEELALVDLHPNDREDVKAKLRLVQER